MREGDTAQSVCAAFGIPPALLIAENKLKEFPPAGSMLVLPLAAKTYVGQAGGTVDMSLLSAGMYVAMVTTVAGLVVGIPAYFGYNYLVARIEKLVFQMEANSIAFMDILNQPVDR